jgi:hypothetical protein
MRFGAAGSAFARRTLGLRANHSCDALRRALTAALRAKETIVDQISRR